MLALVLAPGVTAGVPLIAGVDRIGAGAGVASGTAAGGSGGGAVETAVGGFGRGAAEGSDEGVAGIAAGGSGRGAVEGAGGAGAGAGVAGAMVAAGEPFASWVRGGRRFVAFDPAGDGRAVEVVGELRGAERVVVVVPGVDTTLRDFDRGLGGVAQRAPAVQARAVYEAVRKRDAGARVAVVAWLGYDPPEGMTLEVARDVRARAGARELVRFVRGLPAGAEVTLVGHSYGAVVAGLAVRELPRVRDVVALGAPGMGADRVAELGGARVWAALAAGDWVRRVPQARVGHLGYGVRPSEPEFGAAALPVDGVRGHDGYLDAGSVTLRATAAVILGIGRATESGAAQSILTGMRDAA